MEKTNLLQSRLGTYISYRIKSIFPKTIFGFLGMFIFLTNLSFGQSKKYLILLKDKTGTPYTVTKPQEFLSKRSIQRRENQGIAINVRDLPVNPVYVQNIQQTGAKIWYTSRWLNAVMIESDLVTLQKVKNLGFVKGLDGNFALNDIKIQSIHEAKMEVNDLPESYGNSLTQVAMLGADKMHENGFRGEGMLIGVFDGGFLNADRVPYFSAVFEEKRVLATYDFVNKKPYVYDDDSHGTSVLSTIAGYAPGKLIGTAFKASFVLCKTESIFTETRTEEANWLIAAEYADSLGVDVINSSLGYYDFDDPATNYTYSNLNGKTTLITRAADLCAAVGMIVCTSAGNEGAKPWKYISAPADADSVLAIGAVDRNKIPASFTSRGPSADGRVKPDVSAMGLSTTVGNSTGAIVTGNGTSFSSPLMAGLVAAFWQAYPYLTNMQVMDYIRRSADKYATPDIFVGYGIPNFAKASALVPPRLTEGQLLVYPNPSSGQRLRVEFLAKHDGELFTASLYDMRGTILYETNISGKLANLSFDNQSLSPGIYLWKFKSNTANYVLKWIKI